MKISELKKRKFHVSVADMTLHRGALLSDEMFMHKLCMNIVNKVRKISKFLPDFFDITYVDYYVDGIDHPAIRVDNEKGFEMYIISLKKHNSKDVFRIFKDRHYVRRADDICGDMFTTDQLLEWLNEHYRIGDAVLNSI